MPLFRYRNSSGQLQAVRGQANSASGVWWQGMPIVEYFINSLMGQPVAMMGAFESTVIRVSGLWKEYYYFPDGKVIAAWDHDMGLTVVPVVEPIVGANALPESLSIAPDDTYRSIAMRTWMDPRYAPLLETYSGVALNACQQLPLRQILNAYNRVGDGKSWQSIMSSLESALSPNLKTPQPKPQHHSFLVELLEVVVAVVILIYVPELALGVSTISAATIASVGVLNFGLLMAATGALADLATQGIGIAFGEQSNLNLNEVLTSALESGIASGVAAHLGLGKWIQQRQYATIFAESASVNVSTQALELMSGLKKQFDIKSVLENSLASVLQARLENSADLKKHPLLSHVSNAAGDGLMDSALSGHAPDLANALGQVAGDQLGNSLGNKVVSAKKTGMQKQYDSANAASLGVGNNNDDGDDDELNSAESEKNADRFSAVLQNAKTSLAFNKALEQEDLSPDLLAHWEVQQYQVSAAVGVSVAHNSSGFFQFKIIYCAQFRISRFSRLFCFTRKAGDKRIEQ